MNRSNAHLDLIEKTLQTTLAHHTHALHAPLFEAAHYSLFSGGKRLRPLIVLLVAEGYKAPQEAALYPACALEYIHTYSLIHDDLPCMDNDDIRRGKPTLHKVYPEGHAVLTGDFLLTHAFYLLSHAPHLTPPQCLELIQLLSQTAGARGMIAGQIADISLKKAELDFPKLSFIHMHKTAALISTAFSFGAIIASAPLEDRVLLADAGTRLGLAFQLVDDILDGDKSAFFTHEEIGAHIEEHLFFALESLKKLSCPSHVLCDFAKTLIHRTN